MTTDEIRATAPQKDESHIKRLSGVGLEAFFNIARAWGLTIDQEMTLLGNPSRTNFYTWKNAPHTVKLKRDTLERISYILGIYKSLNTLFPVPEVADEWIKKANTAPPFYGKSALDYLLSGDVHHLCTVRRYLDAVVEG